MFTKVKIFSELLVNDIVRNRYGFIITFKFGVSPISQYHYVHYNK